MGRDPLALVEQLDCAVGQARIEHLADQTVGDRVEVAVQLDMVVGHDAALHSA